MSLVRPHGPAISFFRCSDAASACKPSVYALEATTATATDAPRQDAFLHAADQLRACTHHRRHCSAYARQATLSLAERSGSLPRAFVEKRKKLEFFTCSDLNDGGRSLMGESCQQEQQDMATCPPCQHLKIAKTFERSRLCFAASTPCVELQW